MVTHLLLCLSNITQCELNQLQRIKDMILQHTCMMQLVIRALIHLFHYATEVANEDKNFSDKTLAKLSTTDAC